MAVGSGLCLRLALAGLHCTQVSMPTGKVQTENNAEIHPIMEAEGKEHFFPLLEILN